MTNADITISVRGSSAQSMKDKATALDQLAASMIRMNGVLQTSGGSASALNSQTNAIGRYTNAVRTASGRTDSFGTSLSGSGNALDNFGTLFTRMVRIMTAYFVISTLTRLTKEFVEAIVTAPAKMELWNIQLRTLIGNATIAGEKMELMKNIAIETPLEMPDLMEGLTVLQAFRVEVSDHTLPLIADLAAVSGRSFKDVSEVIGKVIAGSAPAITRSLPTMGIDPNEFKKLAAELGSRSEAIFQIITQKFKGFAKESASSILGIWSNIKDALFVIFASIGDALIPLERSILGGVFTNLQDLRHNDEMLDHFRVTVRVFAEQVINAGKHVLDFAKLIYNVIQALGGFKSIMEVLAGIWLTRFVINLTLGLATLNPWVVALTAAAGIISILNGRFGQHQTEVTQAMVAEQMFAESLAHTNEIYLKSINLVDAAVAKRQAGALAGLVGEGDTIFSGLSRHLGPDFTGMEEFLSKAQIVGGQLPQSAAIKQTIDDIRRLGTFFNRGLNQSQMLEGMKTGISQLMGLLSTGAQHFNNIAKESQTAADVMANSFVPATGEIIDKSKDFSNALKAIHDGYVKARQEQVELMGNRIDLVGAKQTLGIITPQVAVAQLTALRDQISNEVKGLLSSQDPFDLDIAIKLNAKIENIDSDIKKLIKDPISDALESAIRSAVQKGADVLGDALSELFVPTGKGIENAMKQAFAGIINLLGDTLIQLGLAKLVFDDLITKIVSLIPGGGFAAIAAGVALKAFAGSILNSMSSGGSASGSGASAGGSSGGSVSFPSFSPRGAGAGGTNITVNAIDAKTAKEWFDANPEVGAAMVQHVARRDKDTGGSAYGVFGTQMRTA